MSFFFLCGVMSFEIADAGIISTKMTNKIPDWIIPSYTGCIIIHGTIVQ